MPDIFDPVLIFDKFLFSKTFWVNAVLIFCISLWIKKKWLRSHPLSSYFYPFLALKLICSLIITYLQFKPGVEIFNIGDSAPFFSIGQLYYFTFLESPIKYFTQLWNAYPTHPYILNFGENFYGWMLVQPKVLFFTKVLSLFSILTFGNVMATALYFSFVSFLGIWKLVSALIRSFPRSQYLLIIALFLSPGLLIFSSIILKEALVCAGFFFIIGIAINFVFNNRKPKKIEWFFLVIAFFVVFRLKPLYLLLLIPSVQAYMIFSNGLFYSTETIGKEWLRKLSLFFGMTIATLLVAFLFIHPGNFSLLEYIYSEYSVGLNDSVGTLHVEYKNLLPTHFSFIKHIPFSFGAVLFKPFIWECHNATHFVAGIENFLVLLLSCFAMSGIIFYFFSAKINFISLLHQKEMHICVLLLLFITTGAVLLGFTTPNFGTLYRYRIIFYPFFVFILLRIIHKFITHFHATD